MINIEITPYKQLQHGNGNVNNDIAIINID